MTKLRCVVMRGGSSRGLIVETPILPTDPAERERVVAGLFGAGSAGQIDGLGGGLPNTSKVAVVARSDDPAADIDYLFGQVSVREPTVDFSGTCGNMASAVALYAAQESFTDRADPARVRIRDVSSGQVVECRVLDEPAAGFADAAMPGTGTAVSLDLAGMQGATTGSVRPTGRLTEPLTRADGTSVPATIVDVGNVMAFVPAAALRLTGTETPEEIEGSAAMAELAHLRAAVAVALGWCATPEEWAASASRLPFVATVAAVAGGDADLVVRLYAVGRVHRSIAVTAVASTGSAAAMPGSVVQDLLGRPLPDGTPLRIAHPGGIATVAVTPGADGAPATSLRYVRTARRLMEGTAYAPADQGQLVP